MRRSSLSKSSESSIMGRKKRAVPDQVQPARRGGEAARRHDGGGGGQVHQRRQPQPRRERVGGRGPVLRLAQEAEPGVGAGVPRQPRRRRQQRAAVHLQPNYIMKSKLFWSCPQRCYWTVIWLLSAVLATFCVHWNPSTATIYSQLQSQFIYFFTTIISIRQSSKSLKLRLESYV